MARSRCGVGNYPGKSCFCFGRPALNSPPFPACDIAVRMAWFPNVRRDIDLDVFVILYVFLKTVESLIAGWRRVMKLMLPCIYS